ncbi:uncharacterized protein PG998_008361 [Apiospora kogelbergensis]|uniref:UDENN FLCN/SMCR8-type domain-containing protein n=1 Tax=Apiospora kogelbergensis TaxID=1337665 RepID=A0AAW0QC69_9PEZI
MVVTHRPPTSDPLLTSHIQLCLAHYCDLHGPTPLMVTEGLPVPCSHCYDDSLDQSRPQTSAAVTSHPSVTEAMRKMHLTTSRSSSLPSSEQEAHVHRAAVRRTSKLSTHKQAGAANSAIETPPQSPRKAPEPPSNEAHSRTDPNFRRTYDPDVTKNASPCQNCALTLPKLQESNSSREQDKKGGAQAGLRDPTLRTRAPYARVYGSSSRDTSPPNSNPQSSCASDDEDAEISPTDATSHPPTAFRPETSASQSSVSSKSSHQSHTHYLDYTSTHEPQIANTYSIVRASCLRTLSFETLPRRPEHASNYSASMSNQGGNTMSAATHSSFASSSSALSHHNAPASQSSGGPIFFGDPLAGYTTAFIFRIPDRHARGRRRVYAFLALSTHRERVAMKAFNFLSVKFQELADWIVGLAEAEAEREREREEGNSPITSLQSQYTNTNGAYGNGRGGDAPGPRDSGIGLGGGSFDREKPDRDSGSSFLSGGSRSGFIQRMGGMGGTMGPAGFAPKARGLAELVGRPDFFIELHAKFVKLLLELSVVMGS